jgi:hypothetical protein
MDFEHWQSAKGSRVLWLSGPAECHISDASSRIVDLAKETASEAQHLALYFFCSTAPTETLAAITFVSTILHQLVSCLPQVRKAVTNVFLGALIDAILREKSLSNPSMPRFIMGDSREATIKKVLQASSNGYWRALRAVMDIMHQRGLSLIIDGLDKIEHQKYEFIREVCALSSTSGKDLPQPGYCSRADRKLRLKKYSLGCHVLSMIRKEKVRLFLIPKINN